MLPPGLNTADSVLEDSLAATLWNVLLGGEEAKAIWHHCCSLRKNTFYFEESYQEDLCDVLISPICPAEHGVTVFDHGGHPVTIGTVLPWQEAERFHLQVDQVGQWISPRDFILHCLPDFRAVPSGWLGHGSCWPLDGCCSSVKEVFGSLFLIKERGERGI